MQKLNSFFVSLATFAASCSVAFAHPGHGHDVLATSWLHWFVEPVHSVGLVVAATLLTFLTTKFVTRRVSSAS